MYWVTCLKLFPWLFISVTTFGENIRPGQWQPYECIVRGINILPSVACCPWTKGHCISNQFNTRLTFTFLAYLNFATFIGGHLWYLSVGIWSYFDIYLEITFIIISDIWRLACGCMPDFIMQIYLADLCNTVHWQIF